MKVELTVKRQEDPQSQSYYQTFNVDVAADFSVSQILEHLNAQGIDITWECSCRQKLCGACAMVINGRPGLACAVFISDFDKKNKGEIKLRLEPLTKFPVLRDLKVDRSAVYEQYRLSRIWLQEKAAVKPKELAYQYDSAACLLCGCCYEVCPNYQPGRNFEGAAAMHAAYRILSQTSADTRRREIIKEYRRRGADGCSRSLACEKICPAGIPLGITMSRINGEFR